LPEIQILLPYFYSAIFAANFAKFGNKMEKLVAHLVGIRHSIRALVSPFPMILLLTLAPYGAAASQLNVFGFSRRVDFMQLINRVLDVPEIARRPEAMWALGDIEPEFPPDEAPVLPVHDEITEAVEAEKAMEIVREVRGGAERIQQLSFQSAVSVTTAICKCATDKCFDVKGNGNDPFIKVFAIGERQTNCTARGGGLAFGVDFVSELSGGTLLKYGAIGGFLIGNMCLSEKFEFSKQSAQIGSRMRQCSYFCGLFAAMEKFNSAALKTNGSVAISLGCVENRMGRNHASHGKFEAEFITTDFRIDCEIIKNLFRGRSAQIGPWFAMTFNRTRQAGYAERGPKFYAASVSPVSANELDCTIGLSVENEFRRKDLENHRLRTFARVGLRRRLLQSNSECAIKIAIAETLAKSLPQTNRSCMDINCGFKSKIDKHLEVSGSISCQLSHSSLSIAANFGLDYAF
jgi:hypothetical protein